MVFHKITDFIQKIGIPISYCQIAEQTFLPGLLIKNGTLLIDKNQLKYIGDTLHEAGHIALMLPEERKNLSGSLEGQNDSEAIEMAVIAWTYAACLKIEIDPAIVFHPDGYKGDSENILQNFNNGQYFGVPILEWFGMTERIINTQSKNTHSFPNMVSWIRM
ncbi:hypothetical protein VB796_19190 [Arcicella sp. LKC2W]|uniref:hypothetical protein n=1 Tax=Arcicella sp. LKC2W TaxID=2984198 RepID=UPI002B203FE0|nr:hypothetical protein [Arcicella sp. LKC2W]MEA5461197.1 hypothetical protein [Arcicella sp. LKC2W]